MALGDFNAEIQDKIDKNHEEAEWEESEKKNNENHEKNDDISLPDLEESLNDFKRLIKDKIDIDKILEENDIKNNKELADILDNYKELKKKNESLEEKKVELEKENQKYKYDARDMKELLKKRTETIKKLEEEKSELAKDLEILKQQKDENKHLLENVSKNDETMVNAEKQGQRLLLKYPIKVNVKIYHGSSESEAWYEIVPYKGKGKLKNITNKKWKQTPAQIKQGALKFKKINVTVDEASSIIYMPQNMLDDNEVVLRAANTTIEVIESI